MNNVKNRLNKYTVHIIIFVFLMATTWVFIENINYFKASLVETFAEAKKVTTINIDENKLTQIANDINIDKDKIQLIKK